MEAIENYATIGAKLLYTDDQDDPGILCVKLLMDHRMPVAKELNERYPSFASAYRLIDENDKAMAAGNMPNIRQEFDVLTDLLQDPAIAQDTKMRVLVAADGAFLDRAAAGTPDTEVYGDLFYAPYTDEKMSLALISLIVACLWFCDYHGFRNLLMQKLAIVAEEEGMPAAANSAAPKSMPAAANGAAPKSTPAAASNGLSGGCYVATAVYGSYDCPEVWVLRRFRDLKLSQSVAGRAFIRTYYAVSPTLVRCFGDTAWFKAALAPRLNSLVQRLKREGYLDTPYHDIAW